MTRKITILFIINPISGTGENKVVEKLIKKELAYSKFEVSIRYTEAVGHATEIAKEGVKACVDVIVAVGGDGSVNEVAKGLIGTNVKMGIIPTGSGNGFARHLNIPMDKRKAVILLNKLYSKSVDTASVNDQVFVGTAGVGFDAHIANLFQNLEKRGFWNYIKLIFKEINYKSKEYTINHNGKSRKIKAVMISFANASQYGNNFHISPKSELDDGLIDFVIVQDMPKRMIPQFLIKIANGKIENSKFVEIIQAKEMEIFSDEKIIHLDGEPKKINESVLIKNNPKTLKILIPNE